MTDGAFFPEWDNRFLLLLHVLITDLKADQLTVVHNLHILQRVAAQLREGRGRLRSCSLISDNQLTVFNRDGLAGKNFLH